MIYFVIGAGLGFALIALAWPLASAATRLLVAGAFGTVDGPPAAHVLRGCLLVGVVVAFAWLIDGQFLEAERNIRLFLGAVFGGIIGGLAVGRRRARTRARSTRSAAMGLSDSGQASLDDSAAAPTEAEAAPSGPWWIRPSSLVPMALIALPLFALVAPRGEVDLSFIRSVKTPFVEAQFTKNEVEFRLDLESEPQGFFRLGPDGLGDAMHMARNEVIYRERFPDGADLANAQVAPPAAALRFITGVLQPIALCAYEVDQLYGDQEILFDNLRVVSTGLTRALKLSAKALRDPGVAPEQVEALAQKTLLDGLRRIDGERQKIMPMMDLLSDQGSSCQGSFADNLKDFLTPAAAQAADGPPPSLIAVMRNPAVVHAATMFYLWSGNPRAVLKILTTADWGTAALAQTSAPMTWLSDYPALALIRGYAKRWEGEWGDSAYLAEWERAIDQFQARLERLAQNVPAIRTSCEHTQLPVFKNGRAEFSQPLSAPPLPAACPSGGAADCNALLAYGYYTYQLNVVRNHLIFETARETMTHRSRQEKETALYRALGHAERTAAFVEADGLRAGNCFTQQAVGPANGDGASFVVTTINPDHEYAAMLDSLGSLTAAKALVINDGDKAALEAAVRVLDESLEHAAMAGDGGRFLETIRDHRAKARQALGLSER